MRVRPAAAALVVAVLVLGACSDGDSPTIDIGESTTVALEEGAATTGVSPETSAGLNGFVPAPLGFDGCDGGLDCATLTVPLDWDDPAGPTIDLAVARRPAPDPDDRLGALVVNPGGPGASGIESVSGGSPFDEDLTSRFDIVSWDPRGVGTGPAGITCGDEAESFQRLDNDPDTPEEQAALDEGAAAVAAECAAEDGELLPHVGTDDTVRDLEALRVAMGLPMAFYGFSYGTLIGLRYAQLFPTGARSIVLDGVVDPAAPLTELLRAQALAFERVLSEVLEGETGELYDQVLAGAEAGDIPVSGGQPLTPSDVSTAALLLTYQPRSQWEFLGRALGQAVAGEGSSVLALASIYRGLTSYTSYQAISCVDSANPQGGEAWAAFAAELEAVAPRFGAAVANEMLPCAFWPVPPQPVNGPVAAEGSPPILVIGTTGDAATPVEQAERVADQLADGHLLVLEGDGHTAYGKSGCVDDAVAAYLVDGTLPEPGARCD